MESHAASIAFPVSCLHNFAQPLPARKAHQSSLDRSIKKTENDAMSIHEWWISE